MNSGSRTSKPIIKEMLKSTDYRFMNWAIGQIAIAQKTDLSKAGVLNLIGDKDRIVNLWDEYEVGVIKKGSHFMVYEHADEITDRINGFVTE